MTGFASVNPQDKLTVKVSLLNIGDPGKVNAQVNYKISDIDGKSVFRDETETVPIETQNEFIKTFDISNLNNGQYKITAALTYEGQKQPAVSEEAFIVDKSASASSMPLVIGLIIGIAALAIIIAAFQAYRKKQDNYGLDLKEE